MAEHGFLSTRRRQRHPGLALGVRTAFAFRAFRAHLGLEWLVACSPVKIWGAFKTVVAEEGGTIGRLARYQLQESGSQEFWRTGRANALKMVEAELPDPVVLDMAGMTGFEVAAAMKTKPESSGNREILLMAQKRKQRSTRQSVWARPIVSCKPFGPPASSFAQKPPPGKQAAGSPLMVFSAGLRLVCR